MCRFVIYQGPELPVADLVTRPAHSIIHQSYKSRERSEPLNGDGFGVAWYVPDLDHKPAVFRDITPAWNNKNLLHLARVTKSQTILAHVRAATHGIVIQTNCHPFYAGRYAFMHNGNVENFTRVRRQMLHELSDESFTAIRGSTDSEHMFGLFLDYLRPHAGEPPLQAMTTAILAVLRRVTELTRDNAEPSTLNLVVTDGDVSVATRFTTGAPQTANTLYLQRSRRYYFDGNQCTFIEPGAEGCSVMLASEPLTQHDLWEPIAPNSLVTVDAERNVEIEPVRL